MKFIKLFLALILATLAPRFVLADITGPYTPDANTLFLYHFDEPNPSVVTTNLGSKGGNSYAISEIPGSTTPPTVTGVLGNTGYSSGAINFSNCASFTVSGYEFGYDFNKSGAYQGDNGSGSLSADALLLTNLNIGFQGQSSFTLEALVAPNYITSTTNQEIICTDNSSGSARGFQFRITTGGQLQFSTINPSAQSVSAAIPTTGPHAFVAGAWYHVAVTYDGTNLRLYWTKLDPSVSADNLIGGPSPAAIGTTFGALSSPLIFGNENRNVAGEQFGGKLDEIRISSVARAANQMQFFSPLVTISQNPVSQNVDYNQSVTFSSSATSLTALGYQWRFNSNSIAGATNTSYIIPNVAAANAGYYDVVVTNIAGYSATSSPALLVVGAANFLAHRYSFTSDDTDSIAGANGTNFGNATVTGGALVLDGTTGTYMQLPGGLLNGLQSATVEFWANFGTSGSNDRVFDFGNTNGVRLGVPGQPNNYVFFSPHTGGGTHALTMTSGDGTFEQTTAGSGTLDGRNVHVACVIDPPNKFLAIYTNGVLESANTNMTVGLSSINGLISYVGRSLYADLNGDAYLNGSIDELRIYNGALGVLSIKQSDDQGPNTVLADGPAKLVLQPANTAVPVGQTATFTAAAVGYLPISYQWFKNGTPITGATNTTLSFATVIGDNGASIFLHVTNTIGVTTYITNSATATLTVFLPPTLAWLDVADGGADGFWNTTSLNWTNDVNGGGVVAFSQTNGVLFDNRGSGSPNVDIQQPVTLYGVAVNATTDYSFISSGGQGALTGQAALTKSNSGKLTIDVTNTLSGPVTISGGTLQIGNNDSLGSLGSGPVTNNAALSISRSDATLNIANPIRGTGSLSFDGTGSVTVTGNNSYSGNTLVNSGIVFLASPTGLGATNVGTSVASGGQVYITANVNIAEALTLSGVGDGSGALRKGAAGLTVDTAPISLASDSTLGVDSGATLSMSNTISGTAALTASGAGTLTFNANNAFTGGFTLNGPVVNLNSAGALGTNAATVSGLGRFVIGDGLNITNPITANTVSPGVATGLLMVNDNTNGTVTTVSGPLTFAAAPANGGNFVGPTTSGYLNVAGHVTASGLITSVRFGNVRFSGGGDYIELQVRANTTSIGINNGVATNAVADIGGNGSPTVPTFFDLNGFNQQLAGLKNAVAPANLGIVTNSSATVKTLTLDLGVNTYSFSGGVAGKVALQLNAGTQVFTGTNTYTGNTTLNGGTLELATASIYSNSTVSIATNAVLQLNFPDTNRVASLVLNGVTQPNGTYNNNNASPYLIGSGSLLVQPSVNTAPTNVVARLNGGNLELSWPADHIGWRLQVQTNALAAGLGANWVDVPNASTVSSVTNAINARNGAVFYRMIYP